MNTIKEKADFYKALSEPLRLRILHYLLGLEEYTCVKELAHIFKNDQSVIYRHLEVLRREGLVETRKQKKFLLCYVKDKEKVRKLL